MTEKGTRYWFYMEPYVHMSCKADDCLLYNTHTGEHRLYQNEPKIAGLVRRLLSGKNQGVVRLNSAEVEGGRLSRFIESVRKAYMGDVLDIGFSRRKPVQMPKRPKIKKDVKNLRQRNSSSTGEGILEYLSEITLYINSECDTRCPDCRDYCKQFLCCTMSGQGWEELPFHLVSRLVDEIQGSSVSRVNISGGDIFSYSELKDLLGLLEKRDDEIVFHIHYSHLAASLDQMGSLDFSDSRCHVIVTPPYDVELLGIALKGLELLRNEAKVLFVVRSREEIRQAEAFIAGHGISSHGLKPFFNGGNRAFFDRYVFMDPEDILGSHPTQRDIYANRMLNRVQFGCLTILPGGKIHANINNPALGSIKTDSIHEVVHKEMTNGRTWLRTRMKIPPCKGCVFEALCPPPGNYEFVLKRNNLCRIKEGRDALVS